MNQPLRLASGESLYADVRHIYGPLSPYLHAALFHVFGPSLAVLYADGIVSAALALALVYWLARQMMSPLAAGTATLSVTWLCVFKPAGNYILPYSYNALHGAVLGLVTVAVLVQVIRGSTADPLRAAPARGLVAAGVAAALTVLAKTEMGVAASAAGVATAVLVAYPDSRRGLRLIAFFLAPFALITVAVYGYLAWSVGWFVLVHDSWLLPYNVPPELARYNQWIAGFDRPLTSLGRMLIALAKLGALAAIIGAACTFLSGRRAGDRPARGTGLFASPARMLVAAVVLLLAMALTTGFDWDKGPYLAMPFLLAGLLRVLILSLPTSVGDAALRTRILIVCVVYALASLGRMILHARSGGAYGSYLLPLSVVLFTYLWAVPFPDWLERHGARRLGGAIAVGLILLDVVITAGILAHRYRTRFPVAVTTDRGTMMAERDLGQAWNEALDYIGDHTARGDAVAVMPEGTSLDFLSGRRNPLREEITTPGYLDGPDEARAIRQLDAAQTSLVLITNRPTSEFGPKAFGRDYATGVMRWIEANYEVCAMFGPVKDPRLQIGDRPFFIRAYCRRVGS